MKKKDLKLELYVAQQQVLELRKQVENLTDQTPLIETLFDKIRELRAEQEVWLKEKMSPPGDSMGPIDLSKVESAI